MFSDGATGLPAGGGVCSALGGSRCGGSMCQRSGHRGGGVGLGDGDLLGLAGLLSTVGAEALTFQHRGTSTMEAVRDADVRLALHEGPLYNQKHMASVRHRTDSCVYVYWEKSGWAREPENTFTSAVIS